MGSPRPIFGDFNWLIWPALHWGHRADLFMTFLFTSGARLKEKKSADSKTKTVSLSLMVQKL